MNFIAQNLLLIITRVISLNPWLLPDQLFGSSYLLLWTQTKLRWPSTVQTTWQNHRVSQFSPSHPKTIQHTRLITICQYNFHKYNANLHDYQCAIQHVKLVATHWSLRFVRVHQFCGQSIPDHHELRVPKPCYVQLSISE